MLNKNLKVKLLSSLSKVFADEEPVEKQYDKGSMLTNEVYSFQLAYYWSDARKKNVEVRINSELSPSIHTRTVDLIPSEMPCYVDHDDNDYSIQSGFIRTVLLRIMGLKSLAKSTGIVLVNLLILP